jgi:hypothetical protein
MKRSSLVMTFTLAVAIMLTPVVLANFSAYTDEGELVEVINIGPPGGGCICTHHFDPVVCGVFPNKEYFSNACWAACNGYTNCAEVELSLN